jgi:hypothetical protein
MGEREFWGLLQRMWEKGRLAQISGVVDFADPAAQEAARYLQRHALLPKDYAGFSEETIIKMGGLLFDKQAACRTKEAVMIILAHQPSETALTILARYSLNPDKELACFVQMALEECALWNKGTELPLLII